MQSPQWAKVKSFWKNEIVTVEDEDGNIKGSVSLLIRKVPILPYTMMYSPRGPVCDPHDEAVLRELLEKCRALAKKYRSYVLKMDPDIEIEDTQFEEIVKKLGFKVSRGLRNYEGIQPRFVFRLDLRGKTEEQIMADFHHKVRYNIRLAAGKAWRSGRHEGRCGVFHRMIVKRAYATISSSGAGSIMKRSTTALRRTISGSISQVEGKPTQAPSPSGTATNAGMCTEPARMNTAT